MAAPAQFDWAKGQALYEAGLHSIAKIARELGCSDAAVAARVQRYGWTKDPDALARRAEERERLLARSTQEDRDRVIAISASMQSTVLVAHRSDIKTARTLVSKLLEELSTITTENQTLRELGELMHAPDDRGMDKLNAAYRKVISLPERVTGLNTLSTALKTLIMLERQAFNIEGALVDPEAERPKDDVVKGLDKIMDKFNEVLALQAPQPSAPTEIVLDVSRSNQAPATERAV